MKCSIFTYLLLCLALVHISGVATVPVDTELGSRELVQQYQSLQAGDDKWPRADDVYAKSLEILQRWRALRPATTQQGIFRQQALCAIENRDPQRMRELLQQLQDEPSSKLLRQLERYAQDTNKRDQVLFIAFFHGSKDDMLIHC